MSSPVATLAQWPIRLPSWPYVWERPPLPLRPTCCSHSSGCPFQALQGAYTGWRLGVLKATTHRPKAPCNVQSNQVPLAVGSPAPVSTAFSQRGVKPCQRVLREDKSPVVSETDHELALLDCKRHKQWKGNECERNRDGESSEACRADISETP